LQRFLDAPVANYGITNKDLLLSRYPVHNVVVAMASGGRFVLKVQYILEPGKTPEMVEPGLMENLLGTVPEIGIYKGSIVFEALAREKAGESGFSAIDGASKAASPAEVTRRCWDYEKKMLELTFSGPEKLTLKKDGNSCTILRDRAYPGAHVPQAYQSWLRYYENAKVDASTDYGRENPCTKVFAIASSGGDQWGVFTQLRLDSDLANPGFHGSAELRVQMIGDGAGPATANYICR
jgi:hypothetical protein